MTSPTAHSISSHYTQSPDLCHPSVGPYLNVDLKQTTDAFLKKIFSLRFLQANFEIQTFLDSTMHDLFTKIQAPDHCLFHLLPPRRPLHQSTENRPRLRATQLQL